MKAASLTLISLTFVADSALAGPITVQFAGQITATIDAPFRTGASMVGYFTYDPQLPPGLQSAAGPILVIEIPEAQYRLEGSHYNMGVLDDWLDPNVSVPGDGLHLTFSHPLLQTGGGGSVFLASTDRTLFSRRDQLPTSLPPLTRFDAGRSLILNYDGGPVFGEWVLGCRIETLATMPGPAREWPIIFRPARDPESLTFRFIAEPSSRYTVEFTENLHSGNWATLTNLAPVTQKSDALIRDSVSAAAPRFYRVKKDPL